MPNIISEIEKTPLRVVFSIFSSIILDSTYQTCIIIYSSITNGFFICIYGIEATLFFFINNGLYITNTVILLHEATLRSKKATIQIINKFNGLWIYLMSLFRSTMWLYEELIFISNMKQLFRITSGSLRKLAHLPVH